MSETTFDENEQNPENLKGLRDAAKRSDGYKAEAEAAKRELAFVKAGIDTDNKALSYFAKAYDGELDSGAIKAAAIEAGFLQAQADPGQQQAQAGQQAITNVNQAGSNAHGNAQQDAFAEMRKAGESGDTNAMAAVAARYGIPTIRP